MKRKENVSQLLYSDAKRRQEKEQFNNQTKRDVSPKINSNTNFLVERKLMGEFNEMVPGEEMSSLVALSILNELFNIELNPNKNKEYCDRLLSYITDSDIISATKLWGFIQIILNGHSSEIEEGVGR